MMARMIFCAPVFVVSFFFLRELEGSLATRGDGHCTEDRCFGLFTEFTDFEGAQAACVKSGGQLFEFDAAALATILGSLPAQGAGRYWLGAPEEVAATLHDCFYVSLPAERKPATTSEASCHDHLDGFLCQFAYEQPCRGLPAVEGSQVTYNSPMDFEVHFSGSLPPGTIAQTKKVGAQHPEAKHVCFEGTWRRAPWSCEVLGGGCEFACDKETHACTCPPESHLAANNLSCVADPCGPRCPRGCLEGSSTCACDEGYRATDAGCEDVDECQEGRGRLLCAGPGQECLNTPGGFSCACGHGFAPADGVCVNASVCETCEHFCERSGAGFKCACKKGYRVWAINSSRCEMYCSESNCRPTCVLVPQAEPQCYCPKGYILHFGGSGGQPVCSDINECEDSPCHKCENLPGSFTCTCKPGFNLRNGHECVPVKEEEGSASGSGEPSPDPSLRPPAAGAQPEGPVPYYVKAGSVLGIAVFAVLAAALLCFLVHDVLRRCGSFQLDSFKHSNMDNIFYLQQMTTETYKRLSIDKHLKSDPQVP